MFRVQYPADNLKKLGELISKKEVLSSVDRVALVSDTGYLAQAGYVPTTNLLELLLNFHDEEEYVVWREISSQLSSLASVWYEQPKEVLDLLKKYRLNLFSGIANKLGWEAKSTDKPSTPMLRALAIANAGRAGDANIVAEAKDRFKRYVEGDKSAISSDLTSAVYSIVLSHGGTDEYETIKKLYLETTATDQKFIALDALGSTPHPELIQETLEFAISDSVRSQDSFRIFVYCGANSKGRRATWNFTKSNWDLLQTKFGQSLFTMSRIIKSSTSELSQHSDIEDIEQFFNGKDTKSFNMSLKQSLENISVNSNWLSRDAENVRKWLEAHKI
ncbi:hypothetical protein CONCODRAFT_70994 [Conidiobolus coronatus NRRL 28638]|uniref:ERAP1-like C-terminal domain-containing protein n=1 Tax=Conidiobolus coronatus (strain ATCC 28846 / CBS 209.66 / NRRL 28638) TaxID=796925 RepID=A0A137P4Y4_CONC2|nr:hypothetical protein CONCODRAFT_70994 [Conidiobolus coronatus NRRL 28638]|eukprot:KXN70063.1 hypothetical protein CONCODRAFT_70994 [Conidiobolus coronatus NRRL 28638]